MKLSRPRRVLVCPDSFKGSLSAAEAAEAITRGLRMVQPPVHAVIAPLADGGEGTLDALGQSAGIMIRRLVKGPMGRPVRAEYLQTTRREAVIEMARAAGLTLVPRSARNPLRASTYGVGQLIKAALDKGAKHIVVTLGGSATVDGGCGMAQALGAHLLDAKSKPIPPGGGELSRLAHIDASPLERFKGITVIGAADVRNPLLGPRGAARIFAPQKGATPPQVALLERNLAHFARICRRDLGVDPSRIPGAGAAGGLGAGLVAFLGAKLEPGAEWIFQIMRFEAHLRTSDLVITGEGCLDSQTKMGKLVYHVARRARRHRIPVLVFAGRVRLRDRDRAAMGLAGAYSIADRKVSEARSFSAAAVLLERRVRQIMETYAPL